MRLLKVHPPPNLRGERRGMKITMMQLRSEPGEWINHQVYKHGQTVIITHCGKDIAQICPIKRKGKDATRNVQRT